MVHTTLSGVVIPNSRRSVQVNFGGRASCARPQGVAMELAHHEPSRRDARTPPLAQAAHWHPNPSHRAREGLLLGGKAGLSAVGLFDVLQEAGDLGAWP